MKAIRILVLAVLAVSLLAAPLYAEESGFGEEQVYHYPEIKPEYGVWGGYWFSDVNGSTEAGEYTYFKDTPAGGFKVIAFPFPHRVHLEADVTNSKDYFADLRYAYKDMFQLRSVNRAVYHNLENITLVRGDGTAPMNDPTAEREYGYRAAFGNVYTRLKAPHYPAHVFVNTWYMKKDGDRQQRRIGGAAYFTNRTKYTERRDVDWRTIDVTAGLNGHLGPIEAEYSHSERSFRASNGIDSFSYSAAPGQRGAGIYPHSVVPKLTGSTNTFMVHTTYTGRFVATATFAVSDDENKTSGADVDSYIAAGEVVWTPVAKFTAAFRYRHEERDVSNPDTIPAGYLGFASYATAMTGIRNSLSTDTDTFSIIARFRPTNKVTVGADATFRHWDRDNAAEWNIEDDTSETALGASVSVRALRNLKFNAKYRYRNFDDPAYNVQPDHSNQGDFSVTWTPVPRAVVFASYNVVREERDHVHVTASITGDPLADTGARNRDTKRDTFTASLTLLPLDNLSFTGTFGYWKHDVTQDIGYSNGTGSAVILDRNVEYEAKTTNVAFAADFSPLEQLHLHGGISQTRSRSGFDARATEAVNPTPISSFSKMKITETDYEFSARYEFIKDLEAGFRFEYMDFNDKIENANNPALRDGSAQTYLVTINKRW